MPDTLLHAIMTVLNDPDEERLLADEPAIILSIRWDQDLQHWYIYHLSTHRLTDDSTALIEDEAQRFADTVNQFPLELED